MKRRSLILAATAAMALAPMAHAQDGGTIAQVKESGKLRIGVASAEPWFYKDPMSEQWTGVGVAMGKRIADELGVEMVPVETSWANADQVLYGLLLKNKRLKNSNGVIHTPF